MHCGIGPESAPIPDFNPGFSKALELMKQCAKITGIANRDLGRIHAWTRENRLKQARIENGSQKPGYVNGLSECESDLALTKSLVSRKLLASLSRLFQHDLYGRHVPGLAFLAQNLGSDPDFFDRQ